MPDKYKFFRKKTKIVKWIKPIVFLSAIVCLVSIMVNLFNFNSSILEKIVTGTLLFVIYPFIQDGIVNVWKDNNKLVANKIFDSLPYTIVLIILAFLLVYLFSLEDTYYQDEYPVTILYNDTTGQMFSGHDNKLLLEDYCDLFSRGYHITFQQPEYLEKSNRTKFYLELVRFSIINKIVNESYHSTNMAHMVHNKELSTVFSKIYLRIMPLSKFRKNDIKVIKTEDIYSKFTKGGISSFSFKVPTFKIPKSTTIKLIDNNSCISGLYSNSLIFENNYFKIDIQINGPLPDRPLSPLPIVFKFDSLKNESFHNLFGVYDIDQMIFSIKYTVKYKKLFKFSKNVRRFEDWENYIRNSTKDYFDFNQYMQGLVDAGLVYENQLIFKLNNH